MNETKKVKTAYIYARISVDDSDWARSKARETADAKVADVRKGESIEEQIRLCEAKCHSLGLTVVRTFIDRGFSGRMYPAGYEASDDTDCEEYFQEHIQRPKKKLRPALGELLDSPPPDFLIARDLSRIARPYKDSFVAKKIWQLLRAKRITLFTTEEGEIDPKKFHDRLVRDLRMQIEDEVKQKETLRSIQQLRTNKDEGYLATGAKCLGFRSKKGREKGEKPSVIPIQDELKTVRIIYDKYLADMKLLELARFLNDKLNKRTQQGQLWTVNQVRKVLLRPWYAGLQYDSKGAIIESKIFPKGASATVKPEEFYRVHAEFKNREKLKAVKDPSIPGPAIGTQYADGECHPYSSLLRCGYCGKHLYAARIINKYYDEEIPVEYFHYFCKTPQFTKDKKFKICSQARIKEEYPQKSIELGIAPNGYGIIEALFPLIFYGYIPQYLERVHATPALTAKRQQLTYQVDQLKQQEDLLFDQQERGILDEEQFSDGMKRARTKRAKLKKELDETEQELRRLESNAVAIPDKLFLDPQQLSRETMQELAHATFEKIVVYGDKITVVLKRVSPKTGKNYTFDIGRIRTRNSRDLPFWKARIDSTTITPQSKIGVTYFYPSTKKGLYRNAKILYHDPHLEVLGVGDNISVDEKRNETLPLQTSFDRLLIGLLGEPPKYGRNLDIDSTVFFASMMTAIAESEKAEAEMAGQDGGVKPEG